MTRQRTQLRTRTIAHCLQSSTSVSGQRQCMCTAGLARPLGLGFRSVSVAVTAPYGCGNISRKHHPIIQSTACMQLVLIFSNHKVGPLAHPVRSHTFACMQCCHSTRCPFTPWLMVLSPVLVHCCCAAALLQVGPAKDTPCTAIACSFVLHACRQHSSWHMKHSAVQSTLPHSLYELN